MDFEEALDEVLAAARLPKQHPSGPTPTELVGEAAMPPCLPNRSSPL
jgi:hypothetical protein